MYSGDWGSITYPIPQIYGGTKGGLEDNGTGFASIDNIVTYHFQVVRAGEYSHVTLFDADRNVIAGAD